MEKNYLLSKDAKVDVKKGADKDFNLRRVEASKGWKEMGRFVLTPQTFLRKNSVKTWTHPIVFNGKLYLCGQELIFCFGVKLA